MSGKVLDALAQELLDEVPNSLMPGGATEAIERIAGKLRALAAPGSQADEGDEYANVDCATETPEEADRTLTVLDEQIMFAKENLEKFGNQRWEGILWAFEEARRIIASRSATPAEGKR